MFLFLLGQQRCQAIMIVPTCFPAAGSIMQLQQGRSFCWMNNTTVDRETWGSAVIIARPHTQERRAEKEGQPWRTWILGSPHTGWSLETERTGRVQEAKERCTDRGGEPVQLWFQVSLYFYVAFGHVWVCCLLSWSQQFLMTLSWLFFFFFTSGECVCLPANLLPCVHIPVAYITT